MKSVVKQTFWAQIFLSIFITGSFSVQSHAQSGEGGTSPGGGNKIESQFEEGRITLYRAIESANEISISKLPLDYRRLITNFGAQIMAELSQVTFEMDYKTKKPFIHEDGSESGIETMVRVPFAPIKIRTKILAPNNEITNTKALMLLAHEIGHHLPAITNLSEEQKAWSYANALMTLVTSSIKYPELSKLNGDYLAVSTKAEPCRNAAHIETDPNRGIIVMTITTTTPAKGQPRCARNLEQSTTNIYRAHTIYTDDGPKLAYGLYSASAEYDRGEGSGNDVTLLPDGGVFVKFAAGSLPRGYGIYSFNQMYKKTK